MATPNIDEIVIRTELRPGDLGIVIHLHGVIYSREYGYGTSFEAYVAEGLVEFYHKYDPLHNRVWVCEHKGAVIGFLLLLDRGHAAQLRYFIIHPEYRGIGLGKKLMNLYLDFMRESGFKRSYLWTTHELHTAASLYIRSGFRMVEEKPSAAFGKELKEQKYELVIG